MAGPDRHALTARWRRVLDHPDTEVPLDEAALLISAHGQPDLDVDDAMGELDTLAGRVEQPDTDGVVELLFGRLGLRGDRAGYDDPANSYLDRVIARRLGIPISLAVVMIEVGRRRGVTLEGVGLPGHYLVREPARPDSLIDPFDGGRRLDADACVQLLRRVAGPRAELSPALLAPAGRLATVTRMLANLERSFRSRADAPGIAWVSRLTVVVPGLGAARTIELATTLADLGCYRDAADAFDALAARRDLTSATAAELHNRAVAARARLN